MTELIKNISIGQINYFGKVCEIVPTIFGNMPVYILNNNQPEKGYIEYMEANYNGKELLPIHGRLTTPIFWNFFTIPQFIEKYVKREITYDVISVGNKLKKPIELTRVNSIQTIPHIVSTKGVKASVQVFIKNYDVYLKILDYNSPSHKPEPIDQGTPLSFRLKKYFKEDRGKKFMYDDNFADIVIRQSAWVKFTDILLFCNETENDIYHMLLNAIDKSKHMDVSEPTGYFCRMLEKVAHVISKCEMK